MKVSIITVCFNSAGTIRDTIESVLAQTYSDIEYIVVDGASKDNTLDIVREYESRIAMIISEPDKGIYDAMNKGIQAATGDIVGILNSDDFYESYSVIEDVVKAFQSSPSADVVYGDVVFVSPDNLDVVTRHYDASHFKAWKLRFGWMPPHPATFVKKSAYQNVGSYSLGYRIAADYEMFVRLLLINNCQYERIDRVLVRMRAGGVSTSGIKSSIQLNSEIVRACRSNGVYTNFLMILSKIPFKLLELRRRPAG